MGAIPRSINTGIDNLRPVLLRDTFAHDLLIKQGQRIAIVRAAARHADPKINVVTGHVLSPIG